MSLKGRKGCKEWTGWLLWLLPQFECNLVISSLWICSRSEDTKISKIGLAGSLDEKLPWKPVYFLLLFYLQPPTTGVTTNKLSFWMGWEWYKLINLMHPRSWTARFQKMLVGRRSFHIRARSLFRGKLVNFQRVTSNSPRPRCQTAATQLLRQQGSTAAPPHGAELPEGVEGVTFGGKGRPWWKAKGVTSFLGRRRHA